MEPNKNLQKAVNENIRKAKCAWHASRNKIKKYMEADPQLKLILLQSLVQSVLLYSLSLLPLKAAQVDQLQIFYSKCIRFLLEKRYSELDGKPKSNYVLRDTHNIPTIDSKLRYYRIRTYANWKNAMSIAYLNNMNFAHEQLNTINTHIEMLKNKIMTFKDNNGNMNTHSKDHPLYDIIHYRKSGPIKRKSIINDIITHDCNKPIHVKPLNDIYALNKLTLSIKSDSKLEKGTNIIKICPLCNDEFNSGYALAAHYRKIRTATS